MNFTQALSTITADTRFGSYQDFDPELLENLEYYHELPQELRTFCRSVQPEIGSEPYYEHVLFYLAQKSREERE